jgi:hypothetical protein
MSKKGTQLIKLNWDEECENDFMTGRGFEITQTVIQGRDTKSENGIHSPKFGSDWSDDDAFAERYRCRCGEMVGKVYEGETCPYCNTKIEFKDVDLKITGWIMLGEYKIIQPAFYGKLASIIGTKQFEEIVGFDKLVDKNGHLKGKEVPATPFKGIGLIEFRNRFDEILEYYKQKKKNKLEEIKEIEEDKDKVFASCIPVYSSVLRPLSFRGDALFYSTIN